MPVQKKASHGNSGCVPLTNTSASRFNRATSGAKNQLVSPPSRRCWTCHQRTPAPARAAASPSASTHRDRHVNRAAAITNIAP